MLQILKNILSKLGVDWAITYTFLTKAVQAAGGLFTVFLIAFYMTIEEQGFYFTFISVLAIQIFFELGLGGIIIQFVAHEMAHVSFVSSTKIEGKAKNISRLTSLMHFCFKWYVVFAGMLFVCLIIVGYLFFTKYGINYPMVKWQIPWAIIVFGSSLNLLISPWMSVLQGMNKVKEMARLTLIQQFVVIGITWLSLILGAKLYVAAINSMTAFVMIVILYSKTSYPKMLLNLYKQDICERISYKHEIFPLQWRIALSWISGYFIFQLFNPVVFAFSGAVVAGQMGMTLTALNAIFSIALSWTTTKIPIWSTFIAKKEYLNLDISFNKTLRYSTIVCFLGIVAFVIFIAIIREFEIFLENRFLPLWLCVIISLTIPLSNIINAWATYLRCHKKEPFLLQAVTIGVLCGLSTILTAKYIGVSGVIIGYTSIVFFVSVPLSYFIFVNNKKKYHV